MKRFRWGLFIIGLNVAALVALMFVYPHFMIGPGPTLGAHEGIENNCFACHAPLRGPSAQRCAVCHEPATIGLRTTRGEPLPASRRMKASFHQDLLQGDCAACHSEHRGAQPANGQPRRFSHALIKAEVRMQCETCHRKPDDPLHRQLQGQCSQCHATEAWKPATFDHTKYFVLDGDHNVRCTTCHADSTAGADFSRYSCYGCHEHTPARIRAKHEREGVRNFENCVECHRNASDEPGKGDRGGDGKRSRGSRKERD